MCKEINEVRNQKGSVKTISCFVLNQIHGREENSKEVKVHFSTQSKISATAFNSQAQFSSREEMWNPM